MVEEERIRHLEMIQGIINRLGSNSFAIKTWAVGLVAAIFALAAERGDDACAFAVALVPAVSFWCLDGYYLRQERLFCSLFNAVRVTTSAAEGAFSMSTERFRDQKGNRYSESLRSKTIAGLYLPLILLILIVSVAAYSRR